MITSWMVYTLLVSVLVAGAARCLDEVFRTTRRPVRFVWVSALLSVLVLGALAPHRAIPAVPSAGVGVTHDRSGDGAADLGGVAAGMMTGDEAVPGAWGVSGTGEGAWGSVGGVLGAARVALRWPLHAIAPLATERSDRLLGLAWLTLTVTLLVMGTATLRRYRAVRRRWPVQELAGTRVRVSPRAGPAVLGLLRPEIVVPRWLLKTSPEEQRLVVLHEREHVRAHDPLTLVAGWGAVALMPWNPIAWWMLARLRTAVELDCDARVLRAGVGPQSYGSMLIDIAGRGSGLSLGVTALAGSRSTLETRILAMNTRTGRIAAARAAALGVLGAAALLAACEARMLTGLAIDELDVAAVEAHAQELDLIPVAGDSVLFIVDGVVVTGAEARRVPADSIIQVEVIRGTADGARILLRTAASINRAGDVQGELQRRVPLTGSPLGVPPDTVSGPARAVRLLAEAETIQAASRLDPARIVVRGEAVRGIVQGTATEPADSARFRIRGAASMSAAGGDILVMEDAAGSVRIEPAQDTGPSGFDGLVVVDGKPVATSVMRGLKPGQIERIEIIKGAAATRLYDDPRAANGVIRITTKSGTER
jgi:hypothetical protein